MHVLWLSSFHPYPHDECSSAVIVSPLSSRCLFCSCHHSALILMMHVLQLSSFRPCPQDACSAAVIIPSLHHILYLYVLYLSASYPYLHDACFFYVCMINSGSSWCLFFICLYPIFIFMMHVFSMFA